MPNEDLVISTCKGYQWVRTGSKGSPSYEIRDAAGKVVGGPYVSHPEQAEGVRAWHGLTKDGHLRSVAQKPHRGVVTGEGLPGCDYGKVMGVCGIPDGRAESDDADCRAEGGEGLPGCER